MTRYLLQMYSQESFAFLATETTGTASGCAGVDAPAMHATFAIPAKHGCLIPLPIESLTYECLRSGKVLISDEASISTAKAFVLVMYRLLQVHSLLHDPSALLQQIPFILVGDQAQLSAICHPRLTPTRCTPNANSIAGNGGHMCKCIDLHILMLHSNTDFASCSMSCMYNSQLKSCWMKYLASACCQRQS